VGESNRRKQAQSTDPSRLTSAVEWQSLRNAYSPIGRYGCAGTACFASCHGGQSITPERTTRGGEDEGVTAGAGNGTTLRLALGMRGGVSLAVWIGGAAAELDEFALRAVRRLRRRPRLARTTAACSSSAATPARRST